MRLHSDVPSLILHLTDPRLGIDGTHASPGQDERIAP